MCEVCFSLKFDSSGNNGFSFGDPKGRIQDQKLMILPLSDNQGNDIEMYAALLNDNKTAEDTLIIKLIQKTSTVNNKVAQFVVQGLRLNKQEYVELDILYIDGTVHLDSSEEYEICFIGAEVIGIRDRRWIAIPDEDEEVIGSHVQGSSSHSMGVITVLNKPKVTINQYIRTLHFVGDYRYNKCQVSFQSAELNADVLPTTSITFVRDKNLYKTIQLQFMNMHIWGHGDGHVIKWEKNSQIVLTYHGDVIEWVMQIIRS